MLKRLMHHEGLETLAIALGRGGVEVVIGRADRQYAVGVVAQSLGKVRDDIAGRTADDQGRDFLLAQRPHDQQAVVQVRDRKDHLRLGSAQLVDQWRHIGDAQRVGLIEHDFHIGGLGRSAQTRCGRSAESGVLVKDRDLVDFGRAAEQVSGKSELGFADHAAFGRDLEDVLETAPGQQIGIRHRDQGHIAALGDFGNRQRQRRGEGTKDRAAVVFGDHALGHGGSGGGCRSRVGNHQIDLGAAQAFESAGGIDFVSDQLDALARVDAELRIGTRQRQDHADIDCLALGPGEAWYSA